MLPAFYGLVSKPAAAGVTEYYKVITVDHTQIPSDQSNMPVVVNLASDSDMAANAIDGNDMYVTSSDGSTTLAHELEFFDPDTGKLTLWFKAPSLSSSVDATFRLYYGNNSHANSEDPAGVWSNGYEMVVHMQGQTSSKGFADNGVDYPLHAISINPAAYYYNGKVYVVWQGPGHDPYISTFTVATGAWATPVQVGTNPLSNDHHGAPAVIVDNSGYIHVFFGNHVGAFEYCKSTNPEDISAWTLQTDVGSNETYANLVKIDDGTIYLFHRSGADDHAYRTSASTFTTENVFLDFDTGYTAYTSQFVLDSANDRIHFAFYIWNGSQRVNIYHAYLNLSDGHVYSMAGTDMGTAMTRAEANSNCGVVNSGSNSVQTPSLALDSSGNPHIIYSIDHGDGTYDWSYTAWNGSAWTSPVVIVNTKKYTNWGDLYFSGASTIEAYLPVSTGGFGTSMEHWRRSGGTWSKIRTVLDTAKYPSYAGGFNYAHTVVDGTDDLRWVFCSWALNNYSATGIELFATDADDNLLTASANLGHTGQYLKDSTGKGYIPQVKALGEPANSSSGQLAGAQSFDGSNDYLQLGTSGVEGDIPRIVNALSVEALVKQAAASDYVVFLDMASASGGYNFYLDASGHIVLGINGSAGTATGSSVNDDNTWRRLAGTYDKDAGGTTEIKVYLNGVQNGTGDYSTAISYASPPRFYVGLQNAGSLQYPVNGLLDYLRISSAARTANWLLATHNIESGAAVSLGSEVAVVPDLMLWDDGSTMLWDDGSEMVWDE